MTPRERIIPVFVPHLGCPNSCVFCNQRRISGTQVPATAEDVRRAVEEGLDKISGGSDPAGSGTGPVQLAFYGGSFTAIPVPQQESLLGAAYDCLRKGQISSIRLSTRPDAVGDEVMKRLKDHGVETVEIGAQSMDNEVLRLSGRGHTAEDVETASQRIHAAGFRLILQMMTGLPGDTPEKSLCTAEKIIALRPEGVRIYPTVIVKDTALHDLWLAGKYREHMVEDAVELCALLLPMFQENGIPVIRLGLNPTDELSGGAAVAGAYHPALGELVKSRILRKKAEALLDSVSVPDLLAGAAAVFGVHQSLVSQMTGQRRCNIAFLREKYGLSDVKVRALPEFPAVPETENGGTDRRDGQIRLISIEKEKRI